MQPPRFSFLSLFVPNLEAARQRYERILCRAPLEEIPAAIPSPHPFSGSAPVVFSMGEVYLALYQAAPNRGTHPGDVGIGLESEEAPKLIEQASATGARVFFGPEEISEGREMGVFVLPDRHFFEVIGDR